MWTKQGKKGQVHLILKTLIANKHFSFSESFDCLLPEFDEEPIVLYGDEAAEFIHYELMGGLDPEPPNPPNPPIWPTSIPMAGEGVNGDFYCFGINRIMYSLQMEDLMAHNCDLFIVTMAHDPTTQGTDGNMGITQMVLDYKYTGDKYWYGNSYVNNDPLTGVIAIDKKPWGDLYPGFIPDDLELIEWLDNDWNSPLLISQEEYNPDPKKRYYKHDWTGEEIAINWWNLTDILQPSEKEIQGIKVRITDNTRDPVDGYHGNWRRSADVMEQVCDLIGFPERGGSSDPGDPKVCDSRAHVEIIALNPREYVPAGEDKEWKMTGYDYGCNDIYTNFIFPMGDVSGSTINWSSDWGSEILIVANLENIGEEKINPCEVPDSIFIQICSHEENETGHPKTDYVEAVKFIDFNSVYPGFPHPTYERLRYFFQHISYDWEFDCRYYLGVLFVSDDLEASSDTDNDGELFLSCRDHKKPAGQENKRDAAITFTAGANPFWERISYKGKLDYGELRGVGAEVNLEEEQWYGYDDYIKRGGFEIIELSDCFDVAHNAYEKKKKEFIPVQSEADVMIIVGHSLADDADPRPGPEYVDIYPLPIFLSFTYPYHHDWLSSWGDYSHNHALAFVAHPDFTLINSKKPVKNDFLSPVVPDKYFWQLYTTPKEMKWLVFMTCSTLSRKGANLFSDGPIYYLKNRIELGYFDSACGFKGRIGSTNEDMAKDFDKDGELLKLYSDILKLVDTSPPDYCYTTPSLWKSSSDYTHDPSIAAFMEACCILTWKMNSPTLGGIFKARALADDNGISRWDLVPEEREHAFNDEMTQILGNNRIRLSWVIEKKSIGAYDAWEEQHEWI